MGDLEGPTQVGLLRVRWRAHTHLSVPPRRKRMEAEEEEVRSGGGTRNEGKEKVRETGPGSRTWHIRAGCEEGVV